MKDLAFMSYRHGYCENHERVIGVCGIGSKVLIEFRKYVLIIGEESLLPIEVEGDFEEMRGLVGEIGLSVRVGEYNFIEHEGVKEEWVTLLLRTRSMKSAEVMFKRVGCERFEGFQMLIKMFNHCETYHNFQQPPEQ